MEKKKETKSNKSFWLYAFLGVIIFLGVQQYNSTFNSPEVSSFSEFKSQINNGNVIEATIKEQSNLVEYKLSS